MSRATPVFHCPFCGEQDLRPVAEPRDAWACGSCVRVFSVALHRIDAAAAAPLAPDPSEGSTPR